MDRTNPNAGRAIAVPSDRSWFDPALIVATCWFRVTDIVIAPGATVKLLKADPSRIGFHIVPASTPFGNPSYGPWPDAAIASWSTVTGTLDTSVKLFNDGPVVCADWFIFDGPGSTVRITEWLRQLKGGQSVSARR